MEDKMKLVICLLTQAIIWCGYSIVLYLSHHDHSFYETVLLLMFAYFSYLVTLRFIQNKALSLAVTLSAASIYIFGRVMLLYSFWHFSFIS
jgi:hypothetical protein